MITYGTLALQTMENAYRAATNWFYEEKIKPIMPDILDGYIPKSVAGIQNIQYSSKGLSERLEPIQIRKEEHKTMLEDRLAQSPIERRMKRNQLRKQFNNYKSSGLLERMSA